MPDVKQAFRDALIDRGWTTEPEATGCRVMQAVRVDDLIDVFQETSWQVFKDGFQRGMSEMPSPREMRRRMEGL